MPKYEKHPLYVYNSLTRQKEKFEPINAPNVGMYVCGPTVYSEVHIGNMRTFITFDMLYRYMKHVGYKIRYVRNITDVGHILDDTGEDRVAKRAKLEQLEPMEIAQKYSNYFHQICDLFNIIPPDIEPTATGHIIEQIEMVRKILDQGYAYEIDGSVYFDVEKFDKEKGYGALSGRKIDELLSNTRTLDGQDEKRSSLDFALWKSAGTDHIMRWNSPWGEGFPGWHLECSAMSTKYLGKTFDIHGGGMDLKFPHHECEVAQNVAAEGEPPVRYWMHSNMLTLDGQKMSKSLGNAISIEELIHGGRFEKPFSASTIRFFMLQAHYSSTLDLSSDAMIASEKGLNKLMAALRALDQINWGDKEVDNELVKKTNALIDDLYVQMSDDLNSAKCIATLFELGTIIHSVKNGQISANALDKETQKRLKTEFKVFIVDILGLREEKSTDDGLTERLMQLIIDIRNDSRKTKNFELSDKIRDDLGKAGVKLLDGADGTTYQID